jgi:hypothetical protein
MRWCLPTLLGAFSLFLLLASPGSLAQPVINEIMSHPAGVPEPLSREWIELFNNGQTAVDLSGWTFSKGITFTIPAGTNLGPGAYLVIAADVTAFRAAYPQVTNVIGGWTGRLSNSGETIELDDALGTKVSEVSYANEGEWALRARSALSFSHRGWDWICDADGTGKSFELRNNALEINAGANWGASNVTGGTPGAVNSLASSNIAPLITRAKHSPAIPKSTEPIRFSCVLIDETSGATATLFWRRDGTGIFASVPMSDSDGDGAVDATITAQPNLAVIEWYILATDGANSRTWPAVARTSNPGVTPQTFNQVTNALALVDDSYNPAATFRTAADNPIYRIIMTPADRDELVQLQTTPGQEDSEAAFNITFISHDGTGLKTRYQGLVRNRGQGSALGPPNNYHIGFPASDLWNGRKSMALNSRYPYSQALGQALMVRAGVPTQESAIAKVRLNGVDLAQTGSRMFGRYARLEGRGGPWAENHYPDDPDGNFYRLDDHDTGGADPPGDLGSGEFRYEGTDPGAYSDTFIKETNKEENDYSDLINLARVASAPVTGGSAAQPAISDAAYPAALAAVLDIDEAFRFFAADALIGNREGGLQDGRGDDASLYAGVIDPRFRFIPHDLDTVFDIGDVTGGVTRNIFGFDGSNAPGTGVLGLARLFNHPQLAPRYYAALLNALDTWFNNATIDPIIDQIMEGWVPPTDGVAQNRSINDIKAYVGARRANVLAQIPQTYSATVTGTTTPEGFRQTLDGSATFSGTFHVAKTYSITVNKQLATLNYRNNTAAGITAGTWSFSVPTGGGTLLKPGLNKVVVEFWDAPNGTGNVLQTFALDVLNQPPTPSYTTIAGALTAGSVRLIAPSSYIPGRPFLVRVDLLDGQGNLNRGAWDTTVSLSSSVPGIALPNVQLYNGMGSALVTVGGTGTGGSTLLVEPGGTVAAPNGNAPQWRILDSGPEPAAEWKSTSGFDDSSWRTGPLQAGAGDDDERTVLNNVPGSAANTRRAFYFRRVFSVADRSAFTSLIIRAVVDDGAVFYLNGTQVVTDGMPGGTPTLTTPALANRSGNAETQLRTFDISAFLPLLQNGDNLLAVEVHNFSDNTPTFSADLSFDCRLEGVAPSADPGSFSLIASAAGFSTSKALTSLGSAPVMTNVSGTLPAGTTAWNGVIHVTGDVTIPTGATLNIAAGTHVLFDGDATAGSSAGTRLIVNGALNAQGTFASPVAISAFNATDRWGQISFSNAQPSTLSYTLLNHAGHASGVGHTGRGPMLRLASSTVTLLDSALADGPAKAIYSSGNCNLTIQRSLIERMITGPELEDGCALLIEDSNIQRILPDFRESNSAAPDDEDCMYVHNGSGRSVVMRRSVFARCGDDVFDCLGGPITVEDSILREGWDKGMSLLNNDLTISRTQIIQCDKAIVPKSQNVDTRTVNATNCTIVSENHDTSQAPWGYPVPPSNPDPDSPSTGFYTQNKSGQSNPGATLAITAKNCIVIAQEPVKIDAPYVATNTVVTYSDLLLDTGGTFAWPGAGNISTSPLFANPAAGDYRLTSASPCRDTGDPASPLDADGSRADMGALPFVTLTLPATITWTPAGGPYRITADTTVPAGSTLIIQPGTAIYFDQNRRLTVNGTIRAQGTAAAHIVFSHVPGSVAAGDADPIKNGVQTGPPKWGGLRIVDSMAQENIVQFCDFVNAQGTDPATSENFGSVGFIRSWGWADHLTFAGTHLRMCYGRNSKMTVTYCNFPDMFIFDPVLARIENPTDFLGSADNRMEPLKVEYPTTDPELAGQTGGNGAFPNGLPRDGHWRVYFNDFHGNRGHQDVFDADSGRWQQSGQFVLDCRYNTFHGLTGDEHIDLGGDAYIAHNRFYSGSKDQWTIDTGYANAISSGDKGSGTTIMVARNVFFDLDHAINCKINTATIFEHNTLVDFHQDWQYNHTVTQDVRCSAVNLYVPNDGNAAGDGAYLAYNIFFGNTPAPDDTINPDPPGGFPRLISWPDQTTSGTTTSVIRLENNFIDPAILDTNLGVNHPGGIFSPSWGVGNVQGNPLFKDKAARDFSLQPDSAAKGAAPGGLDYGATVPEWAYVLNAPPVQTPSTSANLIIGGPGIVAYKWRVDGGAWSAPVQIGSGGVMPRTGPIIRQATLALTGLTNGKHTVEVLGQDMAGNWQDADPARTLEGTPQFGPTTVSWTVDTSLQLIRINEVLAESATVPDTIELYNAGAAAVNISTWSLSDDPTGVVKYVIPANTTIPPGGYLTFNTTTTAINLDRDGDTVFLRNDAGTLVDAITFGHQIPDFTIGRIGPAGTWTLCTPTLGAANVAARLGTPTAVRINEWLASGDVLYEDDWIELANTSALPVNLSGLRLTDNPEGAPALHTIAPLSFIAPNGFVKFIADKKLELGPTHINFALDAESEEIALLNSDNTPIDKVVFYPQTTDYSMGRDPSSPIGYTFYELPTAALPNGTSDPAYANALALLHGLRITEIMFNPVGGAEYEFVELRNVGAVPLQLGGVKFVEGIDFVFPQMTLNPGDDVVLVANLATFQSRYGTGVNIGGVYTGRLDNSGEKLAIQLPPPFDANVLTFNFEDEWFLAADGFGKSIEVSNPLVAANQWGSRTTWIASPTNGGDPDGVTISVPETYAAWTTFYNVPGTNNDNDRDGIPAVVEFSLGMSPVNGNGLDGTLGLPTVTRDAQGRLNLNMMIPQNVAATQLHGRAEIIYTVQASNDLANWTAIATKTPTTNWTGTGVASVGAPVNGYTPVSVRDIGTFPRRYMRLQITYAP